MNEYVRILEKAKTILVPYIRDPLVTSLYIGNCVRLVSETANQKEVEDIILFIEDCLGYHVSLTNWLIENCQQARSDLAKLSIEDSRYQLYLYRLRFIDEVLIPHFSQLK
jgi:hypothetical protein